VVDAIVAACTAANMDTDGFEKAVELCQRRAAWKRQVAGRPEVDRERASVDAKIAMLDAGLRRSQEQYALAVEPLRELQSRLAGRAREAGNAQEDLRREVPKHVGETREAANRAFTAASDPLGKLESRLAATRTEAASVEKALAEKPVTSSERPESRAWLAARVNRDNELTERLASLRSQAENAAARIAELAPIVAEAQSKLDAAEQAAFDF